VPAAGEFDHGEGHLCLEKCLLGAHVSQGTDGVCAWLLNGYTGKSEMVGNHPSGYAVWYPLFHVDERWGCGWHLVEAHMLHPLDHHKDRTDVCVSASGALDGFNFDSIFLLREVEAKVGGQFQQFQRYYVRGEGYSGNLEGNIFQDEGVQIGICPDICAWTYKKEKC
jgi:hypothetical protein